VDLRNELEGKRALRRNRLMLHSGLAGRLTAFLLVIVWLVVACKSGGDGRQPDHVAQIATVARMRLLRDLIQSYSNDHGGALPAKLEGAVLLYQRTPDPEALVDGWERPLVYFASESHYVLMSGGRNGAYEQQRVEPGHVVGEVDYNTDIVLVDGQWSQTPDSVDR
jgi:hypothetical protein